MSLAGQVIVLIIGVAATRVLAQNPFAPELTVILEGARY